MLFRRMAVAIALLVAGLASQAPEFVQQYGQRLGGAIDELQAIVARFDQEASNQALSRQQGIARLENNADPLAQARGRDLDATAARLASLQRQREAFAVAGPLSRYTVFAEDFDRQVAAGTYAAFAPAVPVTLGGLIAAAVGFLLGWGGMHLLAWPMRHRRRSDFTDPAHLRAR
ncbi:DUF2937 family protein [Lichenihabitans sp. Uapishka_5]|uniref:DUF2937 family protein n=1 Tax=Lichenihabitans sp. Uapishka_5 TaxID=3037302 RepID=UPI0029E8251D|nr:DUF2937 family protein [Lichenihabitans sp. Uapishka_5]MDX7951873.1 DUF2937 family protein [Lichenihabitans sp. Uapishka_5]